MDLSIIAQGTFHATKVNFVLLAKKKKKKINWNRLNDTIGTISMTF